MRAEQQASLEEEILLSQIDARRIRRWRRARRRRELARHLLWVVGIFVFLYLVLWMPFGQ